MAIVADLSGNNRFGIDLHYSKNEAIRRSYDVTPSDTVNLPHGATEAVMIDADAVVNVTYANGVVDAVPLAGGIWHPMNVIRIWATGTTATDVKVGY